VTAQATSMVVQSVLDDWIEVKEIPTLEEQAREVIATMRSIPELAMLPVNELEKIPLGRLRKNANRLHAVCRYKKGVRKKNALSPNDVRCIDVHPESLTKEWTRYTKFLLFHEYLHALGFSNHNREFRQMESLWPDREAQEMGSDFAEQLRKRSAKWIWKCPSCEIEHLRARRSNGRYRCRNCKLILKDIENQ